MTEFIALFSSHAFIAWLCVGAVLLAMELSTGSGWLLWPAASAAMVGLVSLAPGVDLAGQTAVFALVTVISTYAGRRLIRPRSAHHHDPNDTDARLIGREGKAATAFEGGLGRVFVDGKEWSAELEEEESPLTPGGRVEVTGLVGGARLRVRAA